MMISIPAIKKQFLPVLKRYGVKRAALFGSIVRGEMKSSSDIDLLVEFRGKKSLLDLVALQLDLEKLMKRQIDVVTYRSLHPLLKKRILREQKRIL